MREAIRRTNGKIRHTYFDEFGITTGDGQQVRVSIVKKDASNHEWVIKVSLNGVQVENDMRTEAFSVSMNENRKLVSIKTALGIYAIKCGFGKNAIDTQHLDIKINLANAPSLLGDYVGILGFTLNKALGHVVHKNLNVREQHRVALEKNMRERFEVDGIFPSSMRNTDAIRGVARFISAGKWNSAIPGTSVAGVTHST